MAIMKECDRLGTLVYGSCRGLQLINVARGGTLYQDLLTSGIRHSMHHTLVWEQESKKLQPMFAKGVNSLHHQGIRNLGKDLFTYATFSGVAEIIYGKTVLATQFHPEMMDGMTPFFMLLSEWAATTKAKKNSTPVVAAANE
jgi:putative glutamine amidotransferase